MLKPCDLNLFHLLQLYFTLGVEAGEMETPAADPPAEEPPADEPPADDDVPPEDDEPPANDEPLAEPAAKSSRRNDDIRAARERAQQERDARIRAETERDALRQQNQRPVVDQTFEQEEAVLRGLDLTTEYGQNRKWQIESNRSMRLQQQQNNAVLFEARNIRDQSEFRDYANERNPGYFKAYQKRVEEKFQEALRAGQPQSRTVLFKLMLADDLLEGRIKSGKATGATGSKEAGTAGKKPAQVPRGQSPGARSDVGRGRSSESQKRYARLENAKL